jgi:hypothetical protein
MRHDNQLTVTGRCACTLVLDEIYEGVAIEAEGELGEAQILTLLRSELLPTADDGTTHEHDGHDHRYVQRWTHPSPLLYPIAAGLGVHQVSEP